MENLISQTEIAAKRQFPCGQCGAKLNFSPGSLALKCPYCGFENPITQRQERIEELDFRSYFEREAEQKETVETQRVRCDKCGAETTMPPNVTSDLCPFCAANLVSSATTSRLIRPEAVLPFKVTQREAFEAFRRWISGLWFAPGDLMRYAQSEGKLMGVYMPCWTYDSETSSDYRGERGDYYYTTESYVATENGRQVTRTREVRHTRWSPASGQVQNSFDDILILASKSLPKKYADNLGPWDLANLVSYADEYLSGFRAESYQISLGEGFEEAKGIMAAVIRDTICQNIGGDEQQIHSVQTRYGKITFKHILLPVWLSAYRFQSRIFRILINARNGEVRGERPYSGWKIAGAVIALLIALAIIAVIASSSR
jgi:hypothetical protein